VRAVSDLAALLARHLEQDKRSLNQIAHEASLAPSYLWRLKSGVRKKPSRDVVIRLGFALNLGVDEVDELLTAAEYLPLSVKRS